MKKILLAMLVASLGFSAAAEAKIITYKKGTYNGSVMGGKPHGQGTYTWKTGKYSRYKGNFAFGKFGGLGTLFFRKGGYCTGNFNSKIKINGGATCKYPGGAEYTGNLRNNLRHNSGGMRYSSGARYNGSWKNGKRHGRGTMRYANGNSYAGPWVNGKRQTRGEGVLTIRYSGGGVKYRYIGQFDNNQPDGRGELFMPKARKRYCVIMSNGKLVSKRKAGSRRSSCYN